MPTIATRGGASAKGYGFAGVDLNLTTVTFTSSGTWTAPVGVTTLVAVIGQGQGGTGDYQGGITIAQVSVVNSASGSGANSLPITAAAGYNTAKICANVYTAGGYQLAYHAVERQFTFYASNTFSFSDTLPYGTGATLFPYYLVAGTWTYGGSPMSGNLTYPGSFSYAASGDVIYPGYGGDSASAFGYTFPGGGVSGSYPNATGDAAAPVTYTNVAVTPGNSYSISVPSGGSVIIQYLA